MAATLLLDFDGTITVQDVSTEILRRFAKGDWKVWDRRAITFQVPVYQALREQFRMVDADKEEVLKFIDEKIEVREGFEEFIGFLAKRGVPWAVLSEGLDFYMERVVGRFHLRPGAIFAYRSWFEGRHIELQPQWIWEGCERCGTCKRRIVKAFKHLGIVIYVGDSVTDFCVADVVDYLFARGKLEAFAKKMNISFIHYDNFYDVMKGVEMILEGKK